MLKQLLSSLIVSALAGTAFAAANDIPLEWNPRFDPSLPCETVIDRAKLDKLAGIDKNSALDVYAVSGGKETKLDVTVIDTNRKDVETLRMTVPAGTEKLVARKRDKKTVKKCANAADNLFAGALKSPAKWKMPKEVSAKLSKNGMVFKVNKHGNYVIKYFVTLPEGYAGAPAKFEFTVQSLSKLTWGNGTLVEQYDKKGKLLPESLTDPRWISLMRAPGVRSHHIKTGYIHKDAVRLAFSFEIVAPKYKYDNYGLEIKDNSISLPEFELSKLAVRKAAVLPFPAYDEHFFPQGVSGKAGDTALNLDGRTIFFYTPNSHSVYAMGKQLRNEKQTFWPLNDATVELWVKPMWKKRDSRELILVTAMNRDREDRKNFKKSFGEMFSVTYTPRSGKWKVLVKDNTLEASVFQFNHKLDVKNWAHLAFQYGKDGFVCFINGKPVFSDKKFSFQPRNIFAEKKPNGLTVQQVEFGGNRGMHRSGFDKSKRAPLVPFQMDLVRISSGKRYEKEFTPAKSFTVDDKTAALFNFDHSIDGKSAWGQGNISASINHKHLPLSARFFTMNGKKVQYYPATLQDNNDPDKVLNIYNYRNLPTVADFKAARKSSTVKYKTTPGSTKELTIPGKSYMDYIEIACPEDSDTLIHPVLIANDELDTRSFGDIADSLDLGKVSGKDRANILFNLVLKASDYFMTNQVSFIPHTNKALRADYQALSMLNNYCGFECGPLNSMTANMFTCSGMLPATMVGGYGHAFEQVFYDGKNHLYDLSAQRFFPAHDNETAASLGELDIENGPFQRFGNSGGAFIRQGVSRWYARSVPVMQKRIAYNLNPGEKMRFYFYNNGMYNDIQNKRCVDPNAVHPGDKFPYPAEYRIMKFAPEEVVANEQLYQIHRPFPHYSNAFLTFDGKPAKSNKAFSRFTAGSFCYQVDVPYPIVAASYKAETVDGKSADIEISTDGAKTFRKLVTDAKGVATYAVRARQGYIIRVNAPVEKVKNFKASTEMMFNSRIQNCKLKGGKNSILYKSMDKNAADITIAYRSDVKDIIIKDAPYTGAIPGNERQLTAVEPGKSVTHEVAGLSSSAAVTSSCGITAKLADGKLTVTAKSDGAMPRFDYVTINDNGAEKELTVLVAKGVRLALAKDAKLLKNAEPAPAGSERVQDCVILKNRNDAVRFNFKEIPEGEYLVWTAGRNQSNGKRGGIAGIKLPSGKLIGTFNGIHSGTEFYKAMFGNGKERGRFKWDAAEDKDQNKYPYYSPRITKLNKCSGLDVYLMHPQTVELAAVLIIPAVDNDFRCEMTKVLAGLNYEAWKVNNSNKR
ncbi:MAG: hypothetical protein IJW08_09390 [Lentisphaeria bacterium]|nr:hypothetical protein [Lentisphaeria bacterium]